MNPALTGLVNNNNTLTFRWSDFLDNTSSKLVISPLVGDVTGIPPVNGLSSMTTTWALTRRTDFTITETARIGTGTATSPPITLNPYNVLSVNLFANPAHISAGQTTTLSYDSLLATSLSIDNGIGTVATPSGTVTTPAINQTTTFTITATGANNSHVTASATVTIDTPDLVIDTSAVTVTVRNTVRAVEYSSPAPAEMGGEFNQAIIHNLQIKNIGTGRATGATTLQLRDQNDSVAGDFDAKWLSLPVSLNLDPQQNQTVNDITFDYDQNSQFLFTDDGNAYFYIDPGNSIKESNETNNFTPLLWKKEPFIVANAVDGTGKDVDNIDIKLTPNASQDFDGKSSDATVAGSLNAVYSLHHQPPVTYTVQPMAGNQALGKPQTVQVTEDKTYTLTFTFSNLLLVTPALTMGLREKNDQSTEKASAGTITIKNVGSGKTYTSNRVGSFGSFIFPVDSAHPVPSGDYTIVSADVSISYQWGASTHRPDRTVSFHYPLPNDSPVNFSHDTADVTNVPLNMELPTTCATDSGVGIQYCITEDKDHLPTVQSLWPTMATNFSVRKNWLNYPASALVHVDIGVNPGADYLAFYDDTSPDTISVESAGAIWESGHTPNLDDTLTHETMHLLDNHYTSNFHSGDYISSGDDYFNNIFSQLVIKNGSSKSPNDTGQKLWDLALYNCAYASNCDGGYAASNLVNNDSQYGLQVNPIESFAEEKATICTYKQRVIDRLTNIQAAWTAKYGGAPPADLLPLRDQVLRRLNGQGFVNTDYGTKIGTWERECLQ